MVLCLLWAHREGIPSPHALRNNGLLPLRQVQTFSETPCQLAVAHWPLRLSSRSQPQSFPWDLTFKARASALSSHPLQRVSRQASQAGECWLALILCAGISPLCPLLPSCCALLHGSEASPHTHPPSPPVKGFPSKWKLFLLHSSLPEVQVPSTFFCLCFFFFLLPYPGTWGVSCLLGSLRSSASIQKVFCRSCSTCRCISDVFVGRKVISTSYCSAILKPSGKQ